jgi:hypothetical protein
MPAVFTMLDRTGKGFALVGMVECWNIGKTGPEKILCGCAINFELSNTHVNFI